VSESFTYRPAIDGVRAIAVLSVIVYHVHEPWLPGGFLGVDIFFVLSGFLITSLLIVEYRTSGRIGLARFWARRARRLLPAVLLLIVVVALVEHQTVAEIAVRATRRNELLATLFYFANWFNILAGDSYFANYAGASPVRHTWSLAIEEQFYLVYPVLMAFALRMRRRWLQIAMVVVMGISALAMAGLFDAADPSRAYYGTGARIHQLIAGAVLAMLLVGRFRKEVVSWARRLLPLSVALLIASMLFIQDDGAFYYRGGALAVGIVTAAAIAGLEKPGGLQRALSIRPLVAVGLVSYGLYLWHFPIVVWLTRFWSLNPFGILTATLLLTGATAAASYFLVERPIRVNRRLYHLTLTPRALVVLVPAASFAVAGFVFVALPDTLPDWARGPEENAELVIREAAPATTVVLGDHAESGADRSSASATSIAIVGDSFMVSALPGFRSVSEETGVTLVEAAFAACPVGREPLANYEGDPHYKSEQCVSSTDSGYEWLIENPVDVVLWHDLQSLLPRFGDEGVVLDPDTLEWTDGLVAEWSRVLDDFLESGMSVVILIPPLRSQDVECASAESERRCNDIRSQDETIRRATAAFRLAREGTRGVYFLDIDELLCPGGVPCPATIDGIAVREGGTDQTHFTEQGAEWFAEKVFSMVNELLTD
jgi:peptidoglycan/LPS O-acetylase OafA/YrhL